MNAPLSRLSVWKGSMNASYRLPLVSVIVTNYNYGRFLMGALTAVRNQSYPHVECVVVDDCSTDGSADVLEQAALSWPELIVVRLETNSGQSAASLAGLARASGQYVVFLDADDLITPEFVATHIATHFSLCVPVGFTCCDAFTSVNERLVCPTSRYLAARFVRRPVDSTLVSRHGFDILTRLGLDAPEIEAQALRLIPWDEKWWAWSTMSAMMFRRDALDLVIDAKGFAQMRVGTDCFLAWAVNRLTGSVIMQLPMMIYRIHGSNGFTERPSLNHLRPGRAGLEFDRRADGILLAHLVENFARYHAILDSSSHLRGICELADHPHGADSASDESAPTLHHLLIRHFDEIAAVLGPGETTAWIRRSSGARNSSLRFLAKLPPKAELEVAKLLCSLGIRRYGADVWNRAMKRIAELADPLAQ